MARRSTLAAALVLALGAALTGCAQSGASTGAAQTSSDPVGAPVPFTRLPMVVVHGDDDAAAGPQAAAVLAVDATTHGRDALDAAVETWAGRHRGRVVALGSAEAFHWLTITGQPDAALLTALRALPFDTTIRTGAPTSGATLRSWAAASAAAIAHESGVGGAVGRVDLTAGVLEVEYTVAGPVDVAQVRRAAIAAATRAAGGHLPVAIAVTALQGPVSAPAASS